MVAQKRHRAGRILIGITIMIIVAATPFVILSRYAGGWGVPYFTFVTDRGTTCTNDFTGYHCDHLTRADVQWWGDIHLTPGTRLVRSYYKSTNEFTLDALMEVPVAEQKSMTAGLEKSFGACIPNHPTRMDTTGLTKLCVRANDASDSTDSSKPLADTLYEVTTGNRKNGAMYVNLHEESR